MDFKNAGIALASKKLLKDYGSAKSFIIGLEVENYAEMWFESNVDASEEYRDEVFRTFLKMLRKNGK